MTVVHLRHLRGLSYCSGGARAFFRRHSLDWSRFLTEGIDADVLRAIGDPSADAAIAAAEAEAAEQHNEGTR